ncbi:MAG: hypothetical protein F4025_08385 [Synechococcus sp. SB0669_bin_7]|nr:hypothetical protein [Synechococcus sp. SB0669_bin_7]
MPLVLLAACGGGGGGGNDGELAERARQEVEALRRQVPNTAKELADLKFQGAKFGSVYEAGSLGFSPVTDVSTAFDGDSIDLTVRRSDGSRMFLDGSINTVYGLNLEEYDLSDNAFFRGYSYYQDTLMNVSPYSSGGGRLQAASLRVHHNNEDFNDYAAFGYWLDWDTTPSNPVGRLELGLIADGPDFEAPASLPLTGTAAYSGDFIGTFMHVNNNQDLVQLGNYEGSLDLFVNFGRNIIAGGCIGCGRSVLEYLAVADASSENIYEYRDLPSDYYAILNPTTLESNGQWTGNSINVQATGQTIITTDGGWAGRMSTLNNDDSLPYEAIGTAWAEWRDAYGTGLVGGAFMAAVEELQAAINQGPGYLAPGQSSQSPIDAQTLANSYLNPGAPMGDALAVSIGEQKVTAFSTVPGVTFTLNGDSFVGGAPGTDLAASLDSFMAPVDWTAPEQWRFSLKPLYAPTVHGAAIERGANLFHMASPQGWTASFYGQGIELAYQPGKGPFTFTSGVIHEADSLLGSQARGFFGSLSADTFYVGSRWQTDVGQWSFAANGELGLVAPTVAGSSVIDGIDALTTNAFGLEAARTFNNGNVLRFSLKQPLRVAHGSMDYTFANGEADGIVTGASQSASLAPTGRQLDLTTALTVPVGAGDLSLGLTMSTDPGHIAGADAVFSLFGGYQAQW